MANSTVIGPRTDMESMCFSQEFSLGSLFRPKSIAIVGVSDSSLNFGRMYWEILIEAGFKGEIYLVNPNGGEVAGKKIYSRLEDIPNHVDYVISAISAQYGSRLISESACKGVKAIHFFTSGFSEIEHEKGGRLEAEILDAARRHGVRILGPNCMGLYCPDTGLSFGISFPKQSGSFGFLGQSGGHSTYCVREAATRGIYCSKVISYGNAVDLTETDFLEYLASDPETEIIGAYVEGIKDGARFLKVLRDVTPKKPVIIFKSGTTETGARAAASHTGAISGSNLIWDGFLKQAGAIRVHGIEEIVDMALLFSHISQPKGKNVVIMGMGGGPSVGAADVCSRFGINLPLLPRKVRKGLSEIFDGTEAGWSFRNPVDIVPFKGPEMLVNAVREVSDCDRVDLIILHVGFDVWPLMDKKDATDMYFKGIAELNGLINKPVVIVLHSYATAEARQLAYTAQATLCGAGYPVYPSIERAALAISRFMNYRYAA